MQESGVYEAKITRVIESPRSALTSMAWSKEFKNSTRAAAVVSFTAPQYCTHSSSNMYSRHLVFHRSLWHIQCAYITILATALCPLAPLALPPVHAAAPCSLLHSHTALRTPNPQVTLYCTYCWPKARATPHQQRRCAEHEPQLPHTTSARRAPLIRLPDTPHISQDSHTVSQVCGSLQLCRVSWHPTARVAAQQTSPPHVHHKTARMQCTGYWDSQQLPPSSSFLEV